MTVKCGWSDETPLMEKYHDEEWGRPVHDDRLHFEYIILEGFQAGLSWRTILEKRAHFREVFDNFDWYKVAHYNQSKLEELVKDRGIIRNKLKVKSAVTNAVCFQKVIDEYGSFDTFIWTFVGCKTIDNAPKTMSDIPTTTLEAEQMSKALKKRGFKFVGPTICYAYMQAAGLVNDHLKDCICRIN